MPRFNYTGYDIRGNLITDVVTASDRATAVSELEAFGILVSSLRPALISNSKSKVVSLNDLYRFNQEMLALLRAGIPLVEALEMCALRPDNPTFSDILDSIRIKVRSGQHFSQVCEQYPEAFDSIYVSALRTAEQTGNLHKSLLSYQVYLQRKQKIQSEIKHALYYPVFLLIALFVVIAVLFVFVIPSFSELYDSFDAQLPLATRVVLSIANVAPLVLGVLLTIVILCLVVWRSIHKPPKILIAMDVAINKIPILGPIRALIQQSRLMRMLSGLLDAGTPLLTALKITSDSFSTMRIGVASYEIAGAVERGEKFYESVDTQNILSKQLIKMLKTGEDSGALSEMMNEIASYLEEILDSRLKAVTALFEPALMLILGLLVGVVIISMYLPIFFLAEVVQ